MTFFVSPLSTDRFTTALPLSFVSGCSSSCVYHRSITALMFRVLYNACIMQVYHNPASLDEDLVQSIAIPAQDPNAAEVFYRIITGSGKPMNRLLDKLDAMPLLLLWGSKVGGRTGCECSRASLRACPCCSCGAARWVDGQRPLGE